MKLINQMFRKAANMSTQDLVRGLIYALIILVPTIYHTGFDAAFTTPKLALLRVITILIVIVWGVQVVAQKKIIYRKSPLNKWIVGYGFVLGLTTLFSSYFWGSFFGDQGRFLGLVTMLNLLFLAIVILNFFQSKAHIQKIIKISVWTAMVLGLYGLLQFKGVVGAENWDFDPTLRVFGTIGHSNHFGAYLAFHFMLLVGLFINTPRLSRRVVYGMGGFIMLLTILATASRGASFALFGAVLVFVIGWGIYNWSWVRKQKKRILAVLIITIIAATIFHKPIINRFENLNLTQRTVSTIDYMMQGNIPDRVSWWFSSLAMIRDNPVLGHGLSTFRDTYNLYRRTDYRVPGDVQDKVTPESAHMEYLNIAATQGILGLIVYLGLILCWASLIWRILRGKDISKRKKITALSLLTAGLVYLAQVLMSFGVVATLVPLYILIGMSGTYYHVIADPDPQTKQLKNIRISSLNRWISVVVIFFFVISCSWFTYRQAKAEWAFEKAEQLRGEVGLMIEAYEEAVAAMPWMYTYWEKFGMDAFEFSTYSNDIEVVKYLLSESIGAYLVAYELVQTQPYLQSNLGLAYIVYAEVLEAEGKNVEAAEFRKVGEEFYQEAITLGVNNPLYAYNFGLLLMGLDRDQEAKEAFLHILTFRDPYQRVYTKLAEIEVNNENYEEARNYVQKALEQDSGDQEAKAILERINTESEL